MRKKKRGIEIKIKLSNRWLYFLVVIGILLIVGIGVWAYGTSDPSTFGHTASEISGLEDLSIEVCPSGTSIVYDYVNGDEDTTEFIKIDSSPGTDTCNGNSEQQYVCPVSSSKICTDVYRSGTYPTIYTFLEVTCKQKRNVQCLED